MKRTTKLLCLLAVLSLVAALAIAQLPNSNYRAQGGTEWVIGGTLTVADGGAISYAEGGGETATSQTLTTFSIDAVELGDEKTVSSNTSTSDSDYIRRSWYAEDSNSVQVELARVDVLFDDVTSGTKDTTMRWSVMTNASAVTPTAELNLDGSAMYPETDAGLDLGTASKEYNDLFIDGTANIDAVAADKITLANELIMTSSAVGLTSPTVTFSAANTSHIVLSSDANLTGVRPTGGTLNQILIVISGAGSNTIRFDDGANTILGANITLTEGQTDSLTLMCTNADGVTWAAIAAHDN